MNISGVRFCGPGQVKLVDRMLPAPAESEVTVEVEYCGICGTDLHFFSGKWPQPAVTPGHEFAGVVLAIGPSVDEWRPGDRVAIEPVIACGSCAFCATGNPNLCDQLRFVGVSQDGGLADAVNVPASCLHRVPAEMSWQIAALAEPLAVAIHAVRTAQIRPGAIVAVCGSGSIGLLCAAAALELGAGRVISSGRHLHQRQVASHLGATAVAPDDFDTAVNDLTGGRGAEIVFESVGGAGQAVGQAIGVVRPGGTVVLVGGFTRPSSLHLARVVNREIRLVGSNCYSRSRSPTDFEMALSTLATRGEAFQPLLTAEYPLASALAAFEVASNKGEGSIKVQLHPVAKHRSP